MLPRLRRGLGESTECVVLKVERERVLLRLTAHSSLCSDADERKLAARTYRK